MNSSSSQYPLPPVPFTDFEFSLDPSIQALFPPSTAPPDPIFSQTEQSSLRGFLDGFEWEFDPTLPSNLPVFTPPAASENAARPSRANANPLANHPQSEKTTAPTTRAKPLLTQPQKRQNHIMSEQKRRNAIRDGYASLTAIVAPEGQEKAAIKVPTRGRPKGRGRTRGKGKSGVLFRAVEYCKWLEENCAELEREVERLEREVAIISR